jgi:hypothetical protein
MPYIILTKFASLLSPNRMRAGGRSLLPSMGFPQKINM